MVKVLFKKTFLKDLEKLPSPFRDRIQQYVFEEIPKLPSAYDIKTLRN